MEIIEQIGSYAGLASIVGLAVLSALYFSQARDVRRLREWAGRAPERAEQGAPAKRVVAQPQPKPGTPQPATPAAPPPAAPAAAPPAKPGAPAVPEAAPVPVATAATPAGVAVAATAAGAANPGPASAVNAPAPPGAPERSAGEPGTPDGPRAPSRDAPVPAPQPTAGPQAPAVPGKPPLPGSGAPSAPPGAQAPAAPTRPSPPSVPAAPKPATPAGQARPASAPPPASRPAMPLRAGPEQTAVIPPPPQPWHRRLSASPRYLMLVVAGVLILGGGAAFGIAQLGGDEEGAAVREASGGDGDGERRSGRSRPAIDPAEVRVAVLNGTTVPGLAARLGDEVERFGFELGTVDNALNQQSAESRVLYASGHEREAAAVGRRLGIPQREPIDPDSQARAGDATVVVVAGADKTP